MTMGTALATSGAYARVRHPQYVGFMAVMVGFLLQWPTIPTLVIFPVLVAMYRRLAIAEEREVRIRFGTAWDEYACRTGDERQGERRVGADVEPDDEGDHRDEHDDGHEEAGDGVGQTLDRRLRPLGLTDEVSWTQRFINTSGTKVAPNTSTAITATRTGRVSRAPSPTRRVRSATSARRAAASTSSPSPAPFPPAAALSTSPPDASRASPSTTRVPRSMFIAQVNSYRPGRVGVNSTTVCSNGARKRLMASSGKTTRDEQSPSSWRSKVSRKRVPVRTWTTAGDLPSSYRVLSVVGTTAIAVPRSSDALLALFQRCDCRLGDCR